MNKDEYFIIGKNDKFLKDDYSTKRNNNVVVCGPPGCGKTRSYVIPNLFNLNDKESAVVVDVKGDLLKKTAPIMKARGFDIHVLNLKDDTFTESINLLQIIEKDYQIFTLTKILNPKTNTHDPFWDESSYMLLVAIISYMVYNIPKEKRTFNELFKILTNLETASSLIHYLDNMFDEWQYGKLVESEYFDMSEEEKEKLLYQDKRGIRRYKIYTNKWGMECKPCLDSCGIQYYKLFRAVTVSEKTMANILITLNAHIFLFNATSVQKLLSENSIDYSELGTKPTILYLVTDDLSEVNAPILNLILTTLMQTLQLKAEKYIGGRFPVHIHFFLDDYASYGIENFDIYISTARSRGISMSVMLQSETQLISRHRRAKAISIMNCCDTYLYMGGTDTYSCNHIALRTEDNLKNILELPVGMLWYFRRGEKAKLTELFSLSKDIIKDLDLAEEIYFDYEPEFMYAEPQKIFEYMADAYKNIKTVLSFSNIQQENSEKIFH